MAETFANNAQTTLSAGVNSITSTIPVTSKTGFPASPNFRIKIDDEIMIVSGGTTGNYLVSRGAEGTTQASHSSGAVVSHVLTAGALGTFVQGTTPGGSVVGTSDSQTLTNKIISAENNTITTAASGNLTSTSLNAALAELQTDIDTRATSSSLTTHASSTATHGIVSTIVGTAEVQTLTSKTINAADNTLTGLDSSGTLASIPTTNLTDGRIYRPTDGLLTLRANNSIWQPLDDYGRVLTDPLTNLRSSVYRWTLTGSGTNEYACELAAGGNPSLTQPGTLLINGSEATAGTAGSLSAGQWAWGTYSGFSTVIVRLSDGTDPDTKGWGYIRADAFSWLVKGNMLATVERNHLYVTSTSNGATLTCRMRAVNVPSTPYTLYAYVVPGSSTAGVLDHIGIGWSDGTAFSSIGWRINQNTVYVTHMTNATTFTADSVNGEVGHAPTYFAIRDDGTNRTFYSGNVPDYTRMKLWHSQGRTTVLTPTKVGIVDLRNSSTTGAWFPHLAFGA